MAAKVSRELISVVVVTKDRRSDLINCIQSINSSVYKLLEVIVIDNASDEPITPWFKKMFPKTIIIRSDKNLGAAGGRNLGLQYAKGNYLLFIDDDAEVDSRMIEELLKVLSSKKEVGLVQPKIYDSKMRNVLQGLGCDVNLLTGRVSAIGIREEDKGQYETVIELQSIGCIWMIEREVIDKIGGYDDEYFIPWEDTDFSFRARKAGFNILFLPKAKAWHKGIKSTFVNPIIDYLGIRSEDRAYRISRNKIIFMRKNAPFLNFLFFIFVITPLYLIIHSLLILSTGRIDLLRKYWLGFWSGIWYVVKYNNPLIKAYEATDRNLGDIKYKMMVLTDPISFVIKKDAKSILDVGCGLGVPMELIKRKIRVKYSVGVDLFQPYIDFLKKKKLHDKYILEDVKKMKFKPKSFDVVFASDVIEHMSKADAWNLVEDMERFAKKQVIVTTSLGYFYHPVVDGNPLQLHISGYQPEEFERKGYKTFKFGRKELLGTGGLVHTIKFDPLKKIIFLLNFLLFPFYIISPHLGNYCFVAYKDMRE